MVRIDTYLDDDGEAIAYGHRWADAPPDASYSRCAHPERFEPVQQVAQALVDYLVAVYDVACARSEDNGHEAIELTPRTGGGAPMTFVLGFTELPGVELRAGHRVRELWPDCGCDACDDDVAALIEELEATVLTIAEGGLSEWRSGADPDVPRQRLQQQLRSSARSALSGGVPVDQEPPPWSRHIRFEGRRDGEMSSWSADEPVLAELPTTPTRWPAWPGR